MKNFLMAGTFTVPQSGGAISISSNAAKFNKENLNVYYLNSGHAQGAATSINDIFTFTFADGASFYITDLKNGSVTSNPYTNVVGIPSTADTGYGSTININGGPDNSQSNTYDIYATVNNVNVLLINDFRPQGTETQYYIDPIANFEYTSGTLTIRTPTRSGGSGYAEIGPGQIQPTPSGEVY